MEEFEKIILNILSNEQLAREYGENSLEGLRKHSPDQLCFALISSMESRDCKISELSAVLFRRLFIEDPSSLPKGPEAEIRSKIIDLVSPSKPLSLLKKIGDILIHLSALQGRSTEALALITSWITSDQATLKEFSLYLLEIATEHSEMVKTIELNASSVLELMWKCLQDPSQPLKASACRTTCLIFSAVPENDQYRNAFSIILDIIQSMLSNSHSIDPQNDSISKILSVLTSVSELLDNNSRILVGSLEKLVNITSNIIKNTIFVQLQSGAIEILTTIIKRASGLVAKNRYFVQECVALSMILMSRLEYTSDLSLWNASVENEVGGNDGFSLGKELLCTLSDILMDSVYSYVMVMVEAHLKAPHWVHQHTGIVSIGLVSEGCKESMAPCLPQLVPSLCNYAYSDNQRIKWAALTSLALCCTYFSPSIQISYHNIIMPCFMQSFSQTNLAKVTTQGLKSVINFCNGFENEEELEVLKLYSPSLMQSYLSIFTSQSTSPEVLKELLSSLSVLCLALPDFKAYSDEFLNRLKSILSQNVCNNDDLKNSAIKCIGCIVQATKTPDTINVLNLILHIKDTLHENHLCYTSVMEVAIKSLCVLKDQGLNYCNKLIQELIHNAKSSIDFAIVDTDTSKGNILKGISIPLRGLGDKKVAISTSALENKINACRLLNLLIKSLGKLYSPWVSDTLSIIPLINFQMNPDVRKFSLKSIVLLADACTQNQLDSLILTVFPYFVQNIAEKNKTFPEDVSKFIESMVTIGIKSEVLTSIGLSGALKVSETLSECIKEVFSRKSVRNTIRSRISDCSLYTEELEVMEEAESIDMKILRDSVELIGILLKSFKSQFQSIFISNFHSLMGGLLCNPSSTEDELISSICLFCDYIEHTGDLLEFNSSNLLQELIKSCYNGNCNIRQCAVFGIGLAAVHASSSVYCKYLDHCVNACKHILALPGSMSPELITSTECAAGTVGKISLAYREDLCPLWMSYLPFKSDPEEACIAHDLFLNHYHTLQKYPSASNILNSLRQLPSEYLSGKSISLLNNIN